MKLTDYQKELMTQIIGKEEADRIVNLLEHRPGDDMSLQLMIDMGRGEAIKPGMWVQEIKEGHLAILPVDWKSDDEYAGGFLDPRDAEAFDNDLDSWKLRPDLPRVFDDEGKPINHEYKFMGEKVWFAAVDECFPSETNLHGINRANPEMWATYSKSMDGHLFGKVCRDENGIEGICTVNAPNNGRITYASDTPYNTGMLTINSIENMMFKLQVN